MNADHAPLKMLAEFTTICIISKVIACFLFFALIQILVQLLYLFIKSVMGFLFSFVYGIRMGEIWG